MKSSPLNLLAILLGLFFGLNLPQMCLMQSPITLADIKISFKNNGLNTEFTLVWENYPKYSWMAIGFNDVPQMVCKIFYIDFKLMSG